MEHIYSRDGYPIQTWKVTYQINKFDMVVLVKGTEPEMHRYLESEMGYVGSYYALSKEEAHQARGIKMKVYIAPEL